MAERTLNIFACYAYTDAYWSATDEERRCLRRELVDRRSEIGEATHFYTVFPARSDADILIWSAFDGDASEAATKAFTKYQQAFEGWRKFLKPAQILWGFTRPSQYSRGKSEQDMEPFETQRSPYLVIYPFSKTKEWYLMSVDARQGMMNEHIKIGKQYFDVKQLLLYSFGLQDQEFVVSYEMAELPRFSELVNVLRNTEARRYTALDTPLITAFYHTNEEFGS